MTDKEQLVPYELVKPGWEGVYTGESADKIDESTDTEGKVISWWSTWPFSDYGAEWPEDEIRYINNMQEALGALSDETRQIRIHMGGLVLCDSGVPISIDQLLHSIGSGTMPEKPFKAGCLPGGLGETTQPRHSESMQIIESILRGYLTGEPAEHLIQDFPQAAGFVNRTYDWLGPSKDLTEVQNLLLQRMLLPFEYFTRSSSADYELIMRISDNCFGDDGIGAELDKRICKIADLPEIQRLRYGMYEKNIETIENPERRDLYTVCTRIASGVYELSDCHHNAFRVIENQVFGIAKGKMGGISTRSEGAERERLGRLLFGYALALDK